jgi:hypothetical protein
MLCLPEINDIRHQTELGKKRTNLKNIAKVMNLMKYNENIGRGSQRERKGSQLEAKGSHNGSKRGAKETRGDPTGAPKMPSGSPKYPRNAKRGPNRNQRTAKIHPKTEKRAKSENNTKKGGEGIPKYTDSGPPILIKQHQNRMFKTKIKSNKKIRILSRKIIIKPILKMGKILFSRTIRFRQTAILDGLFAKKQDISFHVPCII